MRKPKPAATRRGRGAPRAAAAAQYVVLLAMAFAVGGCGPSDPEGSERAMTIRIESAAFAAGEAIPIGHTGDGDDLSPPLRWSGVPAETAGLALICDDPDAPTPQPWVHWVLYNLPADLQALPAGIPADAELTEPAGARQGANSWTSGRTVGYRGPAPPPGHGVHHYRFRLYALDAALGLPPGLDKAALLAAIDGHVLAQGELVGTYER